MKKKAMPKKKMGKELTPPGSKMPMKMSKEKKKVKKDCEYWLHNFFKDAAFLGAALLFVTIMLLILEKLS